MNTQLLTVRHPAGFASILNDLITSALVFALVATAGVLTFAQFIAIA